MVVPQIAQNGFDTIILTMIPPPPPHTSKYNPLPLCVGVLPERFQTERPTSWHLTKCANVGCLDVWKVVPRAVYSFPSNVHRPRTDGASRSPGAPTTGMSRQAHGRHMKVSTSPARAVTVITRAAAGPARSNITFSSDTCLPFSETPDQPGDYSGDTR